MRRDNPPIIVPPRRAHATLRVAAGVFAGAMLVGSIALVVYARRDLTMSHYDARAHVMVARRITDSLTPGWRQVGAVWLPLPHAINLASVQSDWGYRTGYPSAVVSMTVLAAGLALLAAFLFRLTGALSIAAGTPALVLANPNLLYLQSTPMTEPLLLGFAFLSLFAVDAWVRDPSPVRERFAGLSLVALMLTRYEGWCIAAALVGVAAWALRHRGPARALALVPWCLASLAAFLAIGWGATGRWFVASGFFVPENPSFHRPIDALEQVVTGARDLGGDAVLATAAVGVVVGLIRWRRDPAGTLVLALVASAALPWFAFYQGHPFRVRYMVPLVAAAGVLSAVVVASLPRRLQLWAMVALVSATVLQQTPFDPNARMVIEAQWETPYRREREAVTRYLSLHHDGTPILASMGSLGHYMQEASSAGFHLADFLHEGNGDLWTHASAKPGRFVRWVLLEERAEGGDELAARRQAVPGYLSGFVRVAEGGGLALYSRDRPSPAVSRASDP